MQGKVRARAFLVDLRFHQLIPDGLVAKLVAAVKAGAGEPLSTRYVRDLDYSALMCAGAVTGLYTPLVTIGGPDLDIRFARRVVRALRDLVEHETGLPASIQFKRLAAHDGTKERWLAHIALRDHLTVPATAGAHSR